MQNNTTTPDYGHLYDIIAKRMGSRRLKPETIPDDYVRKIPAAGRWGANSQPWEVIVAKCAGGLARPWSGDLACGDRSRTSCTTTTMT